MNPESPFVSASRMRRAFAAIAVAGCLAFVLAHAPAAWAIDPETAFQDPALQHRYETLNRELRCLVCQNQTIADSNATLAVDLRREVREMIASGKSDDDIRTFMTERYGDFVLYSPPLTARTYLLWAAPALLIMIAAFAIARVVRQRARQPIDIDPEEPA